MFDYGLQGFGKLLHFPHDLMEPFSFPLPHGIEVLFLNTLRDLTVLISESYPLIVLVLL